MITQEYVKNLLDYDSSTGVLVWKKRHESFFKTKRAHVQWNNRYAGNTAGSLKSDNGYIIVSLQKKLFRAHRLIWLYVYGELPKNQIDHINGIRNDNRLVNLRDTEQGENHKNKRLLSTNKSGHHGIFPMKSGKFRAKGWVKNKQYHLGYFDKIDDAVLAKKQFEANNGYHENHGLVSA